MENSVEEIEKVAPTNKYLIWIAGILLIIAVLSIGGCHIYNLGRQAAVESSKLKTDNSEVKKLTISVELLQKKNDSITQVNTTLRAHNAELVKSLNAYQLHQSFARASNVSEIKKEDDATKDKMIDDIQAKDKNGLLIDYANYTNLSNSYDSCQKENTVLQSTVNSDSVKINSDELLLVSKDSLQMWSNKQCGDLTKIDKSKINKQRFWIFTGWGVAVG